MSSKTSHAARWSAAVWSTTCGSTGSGTRPGARTRSPRTGANNCAPSASPSEHTAEFAGAFLDMEVRQVQVVVRAPHRRAGLDADRHRVQRAGVLRSLSANAFAVRDRLGAARRLLPV